MKNILAAMMIFLFGSVLVAQDNGNDLEQTLSNLSSDAVRAYVAPVISGFGSNLNSGWVTKVPGATKLGLHVDLKIIGMGSFFTDDKKNFSSDGLFRFTSEQADDILANSGITQSNPDYTSIKNEILNRDWSVNISGPTIIGSENQLVKVVFPGAQIQGEEIGRFESTLTNVKGLLDDMSLFPSGAIQLTVGTVAGTNVSFRYLPDISKVAGFNDELGKFTFWGVGAIHNPGVWLVNPLPIDVGVGYFYQKLEVGEIFESSNTQFGLYASKTFGILFSVTPYAGLTFESSTTNVKYDYEYDTPAGPKTAKIDIELEGENSASFLVGVSFKLAAVNINADYKMASTNTASIGVSIGL